MKNKFDFRDLNEKYAHYEELECDESNELWHYTNAAGFMGIVRNNPLDRGKLHFWFTRCDFLNDTSEGSHILEIFREVLNELFYKKCINKTFYEHIKKIEMPSMTHISYPIPGEDVYCSTSVIDATECDMYICSFSEREDSLDMWRYYSKSNGGYGLKCNKSIFNKYKLYENDEYDENAIFSKIDSYRVIYNNSEKKRIMENAIKDVYLAYSNYNDSESEALISAEVFIKYILRRYRFRFKHECFASEEEYRFVLYQPKNKPQLLQNDLFDVKYREQNGEIVPYLDIVVDNEYSVLNGVLISPFVKGNGAFDVVKHYLASCGFDECTVQKSNLPTR